MHVSSFLLALALVSASLSPIPRLPDTAPAAPHFYTSTMIANTIGTEAISPVLRVKSRALESLFAPIAIAEASTSAQEKSVALPMRVRMESIDLDSPIEYMGLNGKGEMAVPNGRTDRVGWYAAGTKPGETGSAVLAAHVYSAFSELDDAVLGDEIVIEQIDGGELRFVVTDITLAPISDISVDKLFNEPGAERLKLITCAGVYSYLLDTYTHRLIISAELVEK